MNPGDPDSFNIPYGARQAREKAAKLANFWRAKTGWENGVKDWLLSDVFVFASDITPADLIPITNPPFSQNVGSLLSKRTPRFPSGSELDCKPSLCYSDAGLVILPLLVYRKGKKSLRGYTLKEIDFEHFCLPLSYRRRT
jgi:hypothetical protein